MALSAAVIVVLAITVSVISALQNAQFSKNQNLATQYAQEGMEIVRQKRSSDWTFFNQLSGYRCLAKGSTALTERTGLYCTQDADDIFVREVYFEDAPCSSADLNNQVKATVKVFWSDSKCTDNTNIYCHNVSLVSCFSDFNVAPSP